MKTLVIPDIHNKVDLANEIAARHPEVDRIVCLGDYFDDFGDNQDDARRTAEWVKNRSHDEKWTLLVGNHDIAYMHNGGIFGCSGWTRRKQLSVNDVLVSSDWSRLRLHTYVGDWLLTHAGFTDNLNVYDIDCVLHAAQDCLRRGQPHRLLLAGVSRGGDQRYGGVLWCDWSEFSPIAGVSQLFGHTQGATVRRNGDNVCLDTHLKHYAIITDGDLAIHEV
jgi:hypothetical protein